MQGRVVLAVPVDHTGAEYCKQPLNFDGLANFVVGLTQRPVEWGVATRVSCVGVATMVQKYEHGVHVAQLHRQEQRAVSVDRFVIQIATFAQQEVNHSQP